MPVKTKSVFWENINIPLSSLCEFHHCQTHKQTPAYNAKSVAFFGQFPKKNMSLGSTKNSP